MTDKPELVPVTADELQMTLSFALTFDGRKRFRRAEELMAMITAEHLVKHMELSGMVVLRKPAVPSNLMNGMITGRRDK